MNAVLNQSTEDEESNENIRKQVALELIRRFGENPYDLFKIRMSSVIEDLIKIDIFEFAKYLDSRCKAPDVLT